MTNPIDSRSSKKDPGDKFGFGGQGAPSLTKRAVDAAAKAAPASSTLPSPSLPRKSHVKPVFGPPADPLRFAPPVPTLPRGMLEQCLQQACADAVKGSVERLVQGFAPTLATAIEERVTGQARKIEEELEALRGAVRASVAEIKDAHQRTQRRCKARTDSQERCSLPADRWRQSRTAPGTSPPEEGTQDRCCHHVHLDYDFDEEEESMLEVNWWHYYGDAIRRFKKNFIASGGYLADVSTDTWYMDHSDEELRAMKQRGCAPMEDSEVTPGEVNDMIERHRGTQK
ncbi:hypothetical protein DM02DRAFT_364854 [Periconia macrospinosa]|uniref:Uncharacterized protein n=1 Tax=Periconia macrospinosa TaxID=97972 RepID=A0A2V1DV23_9PLEO|nr:hypothetical protein DM02DRAFT_364854 [Periconia macrospinosa]